MSVYSNFMIKHAGKVIFACSLWFAITLNFATSVEPQKKNPSLFPPHHNQFKSKQIEEDIVPSPTYPIMVDMYFGVEPGDGTSNDPSGEGKLQTLDNVDISSAAAQDRLLEICDVLNDSPLLVRKVTHCWPYAFRTYVETTYTGGDSCEDASGNQAVVGFPVPQDQFNHALKCFMDSPILTTMKILSWTKTAPCSSFDFVHGAECQRRTKSPTWEKPLKINNL